VFALRNPGMAVELGTAVPSSPSSQSGRVSESRERTGLASRGGKSGLTVAFNEDESAQTADSHESRRRHLPDSGTTTGQSITTDASKYDTESWARPPFMLRPPIPDLPLSKILGPNKQRRLLSSAQSARELRKLPKPHSNFDEQWSGFEKWASGARAKDRTATRFPLSVRRDGAPVWDAVTHRGKQQDKPKLLSALDAFIGTELAALNLTNSAPCAERLNVFREGFAIFVENMTTYRPFLARIKEEYETHVQHFMEQARDAEMMRARLGTSREEHIHLINAIKDSHELEVQALKAQIVAKEKKLADLTEKFEEEHRDVYAKVKKLKSESEDLKVKAEMANQQNRIYASGYRYYQDMLEGKFETNRQEMSNYVQLQQRMWDMQQELIQLRAESESRIDAENFTEKVQEVVDQAVFESETKHQQEMSKLAQQMMKLKRDYDRKLKIKEDDNKKLQQRVEGPIGEDEWTQLKRLVPREMKELLKQLEDDPHRRNIKGVLQFSTIALAKRKLEVSEYKMQLGEEIEESHYNFDTPFFEAFGTDPKVPRFLRWDGRIRNRQLNKREAELFFKDMWSKKERTDGKLLQQGYPRENLIDFMSNYLQQRFGVQAMICEMSYNLLASLDRFMFDPDFHLMASVLLGEIPQEAAWQSFDMVKKLKDGMDRLDRKVHGGKGLGELTRRQLMPWLQEFFPTKSRLRLAKLGRAVHRDTGGKNIVIRKLWAESREGTQSHFLHEIRNQYLEEQVEYRDEILKAIKNVRDENGKVMVGDVFSAILELDPLKPKEEVQALLRTGFRIDAKADMNSGEVRVTRAHEFEVVQRLHMINMNRSGKKEDHSMDSFLEDSDASDSEDHPKAPVDPNEQGIHLKQNVPFLKQLGLQLGVLEISEKVEEAALGMDVQDAELPAADTETASPKVEEEHAEVKKEPQDPAWKKKMTHLTDGG
jgi:hypothetical protein